MSRIFKHFCCVLSLAAGLVVACPGAEAQAKKPTPEELSEAKTHMEAGAAFYNDPAGHKCEEAYREFKKAYDLSGSTKALRAMGVCALLLERDSEAIAHLEKWLSVKDDKTPAAEVAQAEQDLKGLKTASAWLTFSSDRSNVRITDVRTPATGFPITNQYVASGAERTVGIRPGQHVFTASSDGAPDIVWRLDATNAGTYKHMFAFDAGKPVGDEPPPPPPQMERPVPISVYVVGGLTVALAVPTTIFMLSAKSEREDYDAVNGTLPQAELDGRRDDVGQANLLADIFLGATVASAATTAILFLTRDEVPAETPKEGSISWSVAATPGAAAAQAAVSF